MPALSFEDSKGPKFNSPVIYNRAVESLQKCNDNVLQRVSYLLRYLYAQYLYRYHYYDVIDPNTSTPYIVSGAISTYTVAGDGKINIGLVKNTTREISYNFFSADDLSPPPGADVKPPAISWSPSDFNDSDVKNLYQYGGIVPAPNFSTLNADSYLIYDSNYGIGTSRGSLRVAGGNSELDILHTIVRDAIKQLDGGDNLGSYFIEAEDRINQTTQQPEPAGQDAGTWFNCGLYTTDTLFNPVDALTLRQSTLYNANPSQFPIVENPYNIYLKTHLDTETYFYPSGVEGFVAYDSTETLPGLKEFSPNFDTSQVGFSPSSDTLSSAPLLYTNVLLPILFRNYPRYHIGNTVSSRSNKGFIQDYVWKDDERDVLGGALSPGPGSLEAGFDGTYTAINEPRFTDPITGEYLGRDEPGHAKQNHMKYPNSGGVYYFGTNITYS